MRLDQYCAEKWPENSRSTWQKYIKSGYVRVDGEVVSVPKSEVTPSANVAVELPEALDFSQHTLPVLFEDDDVLVVNKPTGVLTHAKGSITEEFSVAEFVRHKTSYKAGTNRPGIIHRLDRDTSGVLLCVKNEAAAKMLQKQFERRTVKKTYYALVAGMPKEQKAVIDLPIGRDPKKPSTFRVDANGKSAQTSYEVLETRDGISLVGLHPATGRTHQLRVHMAYLHTPIVGDRVYGKADERLFLHAHSLELTLPSGMHHIFTAPVPKDFSKRLGT